MPQRHNSRIGVTSTKRIKHKKIVVKNLNRKITSTKIEAMSILFQMVFEFKKLQKTSKMDA